MNVNKPTTEKKLIDLNNDIIHNFDVSIVMSFYKRYTEFRKVLPHNAPYLQRNGIEVIIVLDDPDEKSELLMLLQNYPFINWKLIINERKHAPRNHASVLTYIIHSGFISGYQNRYGDNLKPPTNVYHRMTA